MRTTAWLLPVGLVIAVIGGCSSSRFGLAKADPPAKKPVDGDRIEYGNPWKKTKKENPEPSKEMMAEMAKVKKDMEAAKAASSDLTPWLKNAAEAEGKGDLAAAKGLYQKILDKDPNNGEAHHRLAVIADQQQDARTADDHYLKALTLNRRDADLLSDMGYSLYLRGKLAESESRLKEALEANPYHRGAQSNLGLVYGRQGKYDQALAAFRQSGTESEAQKNMAQLFPNGRPNGNTTPPAGTAVAENNPRVAPALPTDVDQRLGEAPFSEVMKRMQQEREAAERARSQQPAGQLLGQGMNPNNGQPMVNAAPPTNPQNGAATNWPPMASTAPPTFNQFGATNPLTVTQPNMQPPANWGTSGAAETTAAIPTNVAKPQESNPFWTGNLGNNTSATTAPNSAPGAQNNSFATNMNPSPHFGTGMNPSPNNAWGNPSAPPTMGNEFPPQNFNAPGGDIRQMGYTDLSNPNASRSPQTMNDAQRMAAQMAMATGPGALLPVVNPGPNTATQYPPNSGNGVNWAYGEMSGNGNRNVENAVWTNPQGTDRGTPANHAVQSNPNAIAPEQPWGNWTSPAPAPINWSSDASGNPNAALPPWAAMPNSNAPANGSATQPPPWNGGNNGSGTNANPNADVYRWDGSPVNPPANNSRGNDTSANSGNGAASITIPNWPNAPMRP